MTADEFLPILVVVMLSLISALSLLRRNGNGNGSSGEWKDLARQLLNERNYWMQLARARGAQLDEAGIPAVSLVETQLMIELANDIERHFSMSEMDGLAFAIGIKPEDVAGDTAGEHARELVMAAGRRNKLRALIEEMKLERPE